MLRAGGKEIETQYLFAYDPKRRIAYPGLLAMLREVKLIAGFGDRAHIAPHSLRRAFATRLMNRGASIKTIQSALGHSEANTTFMYLATANDAARPMSELASLPAAPIPANAPALPDASAVPAQKTKAADAFQHRRRTPAR